MLIQYVKEKKVLNLDRYDIVECVGTLVQASREGSRAFVIEDCKTFEKAVSLYNDIIDAWIRNETVYKLDSDDVPILDTSFSHDKYTLYVNIKKISERGIPIGAACKQVGIDFNEYKRIKAEYERGI